MPVNREPALLRGSQLRPLFSAAGERGFRSLPPDVAATIDRLVRRFLPSFAEPESTTLLDCAAAAEARRRLANTAQSDVARSEPGRVRAPGINGLCGDLRVCSNSHLTLAVGFDR